MMNDQMTKQIADRQGFIAALDQSGGSTPRALHNYGIPANAYASEAEMFDLVHEMRTRMIKSPAFTGEKVIGAILFERTAENAVDGVPTAKYLWEQRGVVPFIKVDKGLADASDGVKLMKPMPDLDKMLDRANELSIFGTKMRSVIDAANPTGIAAITAQQFEVGQQILAKGLMPILEPEITITIEDKAEAEHLLRDEILKHLDQLPANQQVMLKLSLPEAANHYKALVDHPRTLTVVALSGGYPRAQSNAMLAQNAGMIASFSRGFSEGLHVEMTDDAFDAMIAESIQSIYSASVAGD
ncbi:MAG: fructose bisphosphate aldolase [Pseudomonadota bacterium]